MAILGVNKGLNASVALLDDSGRPMWAIQEERLSGTKNVAGWPSLALRQALATAGGEKEIAAICIGERNPFLAPGRGHDLGKFEATLAETRRRWLDPPGRQAATALRRFARDLRQRLRPPPRPQPSPAPELTARLRQLGCEAPVTAYRHHHCHAAAAYYGLASDPVSPYLAFSLDGGGDGETATVFIGERGELRQVASADAFSLACLYAHLTHFLGFRPHEDEHKLMGLAPYAHGPAVARLRARLQAFAGFLPGQPLVPISGQRWARLRNSRGHKEAYVAELHATLIGERFDVVAAALQDLCEDLALQWIRAGIAATGIRRVLLGGGFFQNVKVNQRLAQLPEIETIACFPSCGDESNAFGAAFLGWREHALPDVAWPGARFSSPFLGPGTPSDETEALLRPHAAHLSWTPLDNPDAVAQALAAGKLVARCAGRLEFGARALGNRSILAAPDRPEVVPCINRIIKRRDFWMPFAPAVLRERARELLHLPAALEEGGSPYMMFAFPVRTERQVDLVAALHPADGTARAQLVEASLAPGLHALLAAFARHTGIPALLNTSLNRHGEPMATGAAEALRLFLSTPEVDLLILGDMLVERRPMP